MPSRKQQNADADQRRSMVDAILAKQKKRAKKSTTTTTVPRTSMTGNNPFSNMRALGTIARSVAQRRRPPAIRSQ